jgi:hypothetical protein
MPVFTSGELINHNFNRNLSTGGCQGLPGQGLRNGRYGILSILLWNLFHAGNSAGSEGMGDDPEGFDP